MDKQAWLAGQVEGFGWASSALGVGRGPRSVTAALWWVMLPAHFTPHSCSGNWTRKLPPPARLPCLFEELKTIISS